MTIDLIQAMKGAAIGDNPNTRGKLYNALLEASLLMPVGKPPADNEPIQLLFARSDEGRPIMLVFTDEESVKAWNDEVLHISMAAQDALTLAADNDVGRIIINAAGPEVGGELTAYEIQALARGLIPGSPEAVEAEQLLVGDQVLIAPLEDDPPLPEMALNHIQTTMAQYDAIAAGYLFELTAPGQPAGMVAGVVFDPLPEETDSIMRELVSTVSPALHGREMNFMILHGALRESVEAHIEPFYTNQS